LRAPAPRSAAPAYPSDARPAPGTVWKASKRPVLEEAGRDLVMPPSAVRNRPLGTGDNSRTPDPDQPPRVWISGSFRIGGPISVTVRDRCALGPGRADQDHQVGGIRAHRRAVGMPCPSTGAGEVLGSGFVFIFEAPGVAGTPGCGAGPWGILPSAGTLRTPSSGEAAACRGVWEEFTVEFTDGRLLTPPARRCAERISTRHATGRAKSAVSPSGPIPSGPIPISVQVGFFRYREIYPMARRSGGPATADWREPASSDRPPIHRSESPTGYSSAGCSPAEPASASPVTDTISAIPIRRMPVL
jgi:hypothetical protein